MFIFSIKTKACVGYYDWNISYERVFEYAETYKLIRREKPSTFLDVGGDISIFGPFVADSVGCQVGIVDMGDMQFSEKLLNNLSPDTKKCISLFPRTKAENISNKKYDFISCISTIEHFDTEGDLLFMKNVSSILNENGLLVITAPFTLKAETIYEYREMTYYQVHGIQQFDKGFYLKKYCLLDIQKLAEQSGLHIEKLIFAGEVINFYDPIFLYQPNMTKSGNLIIFSRAKIVLGRILLISIKLLSPFYPFLFMRKSESISDFLIESKRKKILCPDVFLLALRKKSKN